MVSLLLVPKTIYDPNMGCTAVAGRSRFASRWPMLPTET